MLASVYSDERVDVADVITGQRQRTRRRAERRGRAGHRRCGTRGRSAALRCRVLLLASLLAVGGCSSGAVSYPPRFTWKGTTYYAIVSKVDLQPADLSDVGEVESLSQAPEAPLRGRTAAALRGVDTGEALVMPLMAGRYVVFKAQPATPPSARLCRYLVDFPGTGCGGT